MTLDSTSRIRPLGSAKAGKQSPLTSPLESRPRIIGEIARDRDVDLVVMATHGTGGLSRVILGSVATGTLRHTTAPLLLVRPSAAPQAESLANASSKRALNDDIEPSQTVTVEGADGTTRDVQVSAVDLELIERGLKALAYAPGYDYSHVQQARALAERLHKTMQAVAGPPVASRSELPGGGRRPRSCPRKVDDRDRDIPRPP